MSYEKKMERMRCLVPEHIQAITPNYAIAQMWRSGHAAAKRRAAAIAKKADREIEKLAEETERQLQSHHELLDGLLDYLYELRSEWNWKKDDPRKRHREEYAELEEWIGQVRDMVRPESKPCANARACTAPKLTN